MKSFLRENIVDLLTVFIGAVLLAVIWMLPGGNDPDENDPYY